MLTSQGLYGAFVIKFNLQMAAFRRKHLANHGVAEAVTLATITAFIGYLNRFLRIDMTESMEILFRECEGGGDYDGLCQWVQVPPRELTPQNVGAVAYGQLASPRGRREDSPRRRLVRLQGPLWYLCPVHGRRGDVWEDGRHSRKGAAYVSDDGDDDVDDVVDDDSFVSSELTS